MDALLETAGFLGTGASLLADLTLLAYLLLIAPAMLIGSIYAWRGKHRPHHKWLMIIVTAANWLLIAFLMVAVYRLDVAPNFPEQPGNLRYLLPTVHAVFGLPAQLLATFIVVRMLIEDSQVARAKARGERNLAQYWFRRAKPFMRLTLALWLITTALGVASYAIRYDVFSTQSQHENVLPPVTTPELAPVTTPDVLPPVATEDVE